MNTTQGDSRRASENTARTLRNQLGTMQREDHLQLLSFSDVHVIDIARLLVSEEQYGVLPE
jgi:hypothetical protein